MMEGAAVLKRPPGFAKSVYQPRRRLVVGRLSGAPSPLLHLYEQAEE